MDRVSLAQASKRNISANTGEEPHPNQDAFLARVLQSTRDCVKVLTLDAKLVAINDGGCKSLGVADPKPLRGVDFLDLWSEDEREAVENAVEVARAGGIGRFTGYLETASGEPRWWDVAVNAMSDAAGRPEWLIAVSRDVTELHAAEERQRVLRDELNHRVKNTLATVMSLAFQTARTATSLESFNASFKARLMVLSKAHELLTRRSWTKVQVSEVLTMALGDRLSSDAVVIDGAPVEIAARAAVSLALALHELATNADRHGALSQTGGTLAIAWSQGPGPGEVELEWAETSTFEVAGPEREGLGLRLVRGMVEGDLGGRVRMDFQSSGLKVAMAFRASGATA